MNKSNRWRILCTIFCLLLGSLFADIQNPDKPLKGEWEFKLAKVWEVDTAGDGVFGRPFSLTAADNETLYVFDPKNDMNFIIDRDGKFINTFGRSGQGPGEIIGQERTHIVEGKLLITGMNGIFVFTRDGEYLKMIRQEEIRRPPQIFLSENEFIAFPMTGISAADGKGEIFYCKLNPAQERKIAEFSLTQAGIARSEGGVVDIIVVGLSPLVAACYEQGRVYWGLSDSYEIHISDLEGRALGGFSIGRKTKTVSNSFKKKFFKAGNIPPEMVDSIAASFSNKLTHFHRIEVHNGLIYVYVPELDLDQGTGRISQVDIFSPEGKYLYRARFDFGKGLTHLFSPLSNLAFKNGNLYATCIREDDTVVLVKFRALMPKD